ncbi:MauE/DoxX family redox-associated membrane protein [Microbacterium sp. E-13]|uniref:MauE/DoxX family redox-associated membrane protein n=1 Tax=Microbacterium sp. E-13 TaxID=3404048 RepID=UPI003CF978B7
MIAALTVTLPLVLAGVLIASAVAKLRTPDDLVGWGELGVPKMLRRQWLLRLHPWGEIALGAALIVLGGWLGLAAALVAVVLMAGYLWLVVKARRASDDASCACFGSKRRITRVTVIRNVWLVVLAVASAAVIWTAPLLGGALAVALTGWSGTVLGAAAAALTAVLVLWPDEPQAAAAAAAPPASDTSLVEVPVDGDGEGALDYIRTRTPAVPLSLADGTSVNLRALTRSRPLLMLAVSPTCGSCTMVIEKAPAFRELLPEVDVRLLFTHAHDSGRLSELTEPQSLHDADHLVSSSIEDWRVPTAVLFGIDGLLAGGPVTGVREIDEFVGDVYESLHGERPA